MQETLTLRTAPTVIPAAKASKIWCRRMFNVKLESAIKEVRRLQIPSLSVAFEFDHNQKEREGTYPLSPVLIRFVPAVTFEQHKLSNERNLAHSYLPKKQATLSPVCGKTG